MTENTNTIGEVTLPPGTYRILPGRSAASFTTRHFFGLARVRGSLAIADGTVEVADRTEASTVTARLLTASFSSGIGLRDLQVRSALFLNARRYPELTYRSTGLERTGGGWTVHGTLTAHGTSAPVDLSVVSATKDGADLRIEATARVNRYAHGVTLMKGVAARDLDVQLTVVATPA